MIEMRDILLVEDSPNDAELTLEALKEINLANKVEWVKDGEQALDYLYCRGTYSNRPKANPTVVLLDLKLPKVDGKQVLHEIHNDPGLQTIPVVVLTSSQEERDLLECYLNGANAYVVKPVKFHDFIYAVKTLGIFWAAINQPPPYKG